MRMGIVASFLCLPGLLDLVENVNTLAGEEGDDRLLPRALLTMNASTTASDRARLARTLHVHGVHGLHAHVEQLLNGLANLDLVGFHSHLEGVLILFHQ